MEKKDKVLLIVNASLGELHVVLPMLKHIKETLPLVEIYALFISKKIQTQVEGDEIYYSILQDVASIIERRDITRFLLTEAPSVRMILKEQGPVSSSSIIARIRRLCWNAKFVLYPHAYALYDYKIQQGQEQQIKLSTAYDESVIDYLLITSSYDYNYFSGLISSNKICIVGALGYTDWWKEKIILFSDTDEANDIKSNPRSNKILLTLRGPHKIYLSDHNFKQLMESVFEELFSIDDVYVIIKPHPRQDISQVYSFLHKYPQDKWVISNMNTFTLATLSKATLSFWSSAITDSLAVGTPTIEYYRYSERFSQTCMDENNEIVSFYTRLKFALRASRQDELNKSLRLIIDKHDQIKADQIKHFDAVFNDRFESKSRLTKFLESKVFIKNGSINKIAYNKRFIDWGRLFLWSVKNY